MLYESLFHPHSAYLGSFNYIRFFSIKPSENSLKIPLDDTVFYNLDAVLSIVGKRAKLSYIFVYCSYNLCGQLKIDELPPGCLQVCLLSSCRIGWMVCRVLRL